MATAGEDRMMGEDKLARREEPHGLQFHEIRTTGSQMGGYGEIP